MTLRCELDDAELAGIEEADDGRTVRLRWAAVAAERPSPWQHGRERGWLRGVVLTLHGVSAGPATARADAGGRVNQGRVNQGRVSEARLALADTPAASTAALPCPWRHAGALRLQLRMAQGDEWCWTALGAELTLAGGGDADAAFSASLAC